MTNLGEIFGSKDSGKLGISNNYPEYKFVKNNATDILWDMPIS